MIRYLKNAEIDKEKWDSCIDTAPNGLIYAYSLYLDQMAGNWDAIVLDDYQAVMPLPWRKKWGIFYIYQPFLTAQLGVFGNHLETRVLPGFLNSIPAKFRLWEFPFNSGNPLSLEGYQTFPRSNYVLSLHQPYEVLYKQYRENVRRNVKKSQQYGCYPAKAISIDDVIAIASESGTDDPEGLRHFRHLYQHLLPSGQAITYGMFSARDQLLASAAFLFSHKRAYYLLVGNHPNGRTLGASHALIDAFIKDHAGQELILDFEGSDIRNLAFFYSSFGAKEEIYPAIKRNRLPRFLKIFKK